jgi:F-type H+-transporting ATPase subunit gamma
MVAAARLRRAEQRIEELRPYAEAIRRMTRQASEAAGHVANLPILAEHESVSTVGLLVVAGDRGLAGAFNSQVVRAGVSAGREHEQESHRTVYWASGRRPASSLAFRGLEVADSFTGFTDRPAYADARRIAERVMAAYIDGDVDRVEIFYNGYISPISQDVRRETLLPLQQASARRQTRSTRPRPSTSPALRRSSAGSCQTTWRSRSTGRCSSPPPPSTARA